MAKRKKRIVACYARVSTSSKEQASSYENQQSFFNDFIRRSGDMKLYKIYPDRGISGTLFKREQFELMLYDAGLDVQINPQKIIKEKNLNVLSDEAEGKPSVVHYINYIIDISPDREPKFNEILVRNTSRFARNIEVDTILRRLRQNGVYVRFLDIDKTTEREEDISIIQLFQTFDELFVRDLSRKVLAGNERSVANKVLRSHPKLYGYKYIPRPNLQENNKLTPIPHEAEVIQKIFRLYNGCLTVETLNTEGFIGCDFACSTCTIKRTSGLGIRRIIKYLSAEGIKTRAKKNFGSTTMKNILSNEKYAGFINTGKYTSGTVFNKLTTPTVKDDYLLELDPTNIDPIISPELFYSCEAIRESRITREDSKGKSPSRSAYGGGFLICGKCGSAYQHNVDRGRPFYVCGGKRRKGLTYCNSANVGETTVDARLTLYEQGELSLILFAYRQSVIIRHLNAINYRLSFIRRNRDDDKVQALQEQYKKLNKRLDNLYIRHADEEGDLTVLDNLIAQTKADLDSLNTELESYTKKPLQYLAEAEELQSRAEELLSVHSEHAQNLSNTTYTREDIFASIAYLTVRGETNPHGGGREAEVELVPALYSDPELEDFLSADAKEFKTYKPLKFKSDKGSFIGVSDPEETEENFNISPLKKKEADALNTDSENTKLYAPKVLKSTFDDLSETLEALQELY